MKKELIELNQDNWKTLTDETRKVLIELEEVAETISHDGVTVLSSFKLGHSNMYAIRHYYRDNMCYSVFIKIDGCSPIMLLRIPLENVGACAGIAVDGKTLEKTIRYIIDMCEKHTKELNDRIQITFSTIASKQL